MPARLWPSPVLKHGIWGKIQIPKFRHVVESSAWGTRNKAKTAEPLKWSRFRHVWSLTSPAQSRTSDTLTCLGTATPAGQPGWLCLELPSPSPWPRDSLKAMLEVKLPFPHYKKSPELSFQFEISAISLSMCRVILISDALKPSSRPVFFNLSYLWYSPFLLQKHS